LSSHHSPRPAPPGAEGR